MRREFSAKTKALAFARSGGRCEHPDCGLKLYTAGIEFDHEIPCEMGGDNSVDNCRVLCRLHHMEKTSTADIPNIARAKRRHQRHIGIKRGGRPMAGSKRSGWRKRMNGTVERW
jgi:5-methylcytosine-specific restriction endonuclease McrA